MDFKIIKDNPLLFFILALITLNVYNLSSYMYIGIILLGFSNKNLKGGSRYPIGLSFALLIATLLCMDSYYITWGVKMLLISYAGMMVVKRGDTIDKYRTIILFCSYGFALQLILSYFYNLSMGIVGGREFISISTMSIMSATGFAILLVPFAGIVCYYLFHIYDLKRVRLILFLSILVLTLMANLWLEGRTYFTILAISFTLGLLFSFRNAIGRIERGQLRKSVKYIILAVIVLTPLLADKVINVYETSNFYERFNRGYEDISETPRTERVIFYLNHFFDSPFGGGHIKDQLQGCRAHNMFLDGLDACGIATFIMLLAITFFSYKVYRTFYMQTSGVDLPTRCLFFCTFVSINASFFTEPIIEGSQWLLEYYWFITCALFAYSTKRV